VDQPDTDVVALSCSNNGGWRTPHGHDRSGR
jgi:hypothetical protein